MEQFKTFEPDDPELVKSLRDKNVKIAAKPEDDSPWYMVLLLNWFPMLLLHRRVDIFYAPDAGGRRQGDVLWQEPRKTAYGESTPRNL